MKNALVTGVSRGIGRQIAKQLATAGYNIYGGYKWSKDYKEEKAEAESLKNEIKNLTLLPCDLADNKAVEELIAQLKGIKLDVIINNAGEVFLNKWDQLNMEDWDRTIAVNLTAPLKLVHGLRNNLLGGGVVVNIASVDGFCAAYDTVAYAASKAGLINLTKSLGAILGERGIRVNAIAPGWVETNMTKDTLPKEATDMTPLHRNAQAEDVANLVSFLVSDKASFINGETIILDGGLTTVDYTLKKESGL